MQSVQVGKEHLGLKAITDVLQDLQYKVSIKEYDL